MAKLVTSQGFTSDLLTRYVSTLIETMPEPLNTCYLTNSGSEANDLALRLAAAVTGTEDVLVVVSLFCLFSNLITIYFKGGWIPWEHKISCGRFTENNFPKQIR